MPKPTETDLDQEFKEAYAALNMKYDEPDELGKPLRKSYWFIKDLKKVAVFLYADVDFNDALAQLEADMVKLYETRSGKALTLIGKRSVAESWMGEPVPAHSAFLLQSVLASTEKDEKFSDIEEVDGKLHPMRFYGNLEAKSFASNIQARHLAVDFVGGDHGEYTHRIQWYCIAKKAGALALDCRSRGDNSTGELFQRSGPVWTKVFDRTETSDTNDFRRPERLNLFLGNPSDDTKRKYPLLTGFLRSRRAKTNGYSLEVKILLVAQSAYGKKVKDGFLLFTPTLANQEIARLRTLTANPLTDIEEKEIRGFLETNRVMTGKEKFSVGSLEKAI